MTAIIRRTIFVILVGTILQGQAAAPAAFILKRGGWEENPNMHGVRVGNTTVVILHADGKAIRYGGEVWEDEEKKRFELQSKSGFTAEGGDWTSNPKGVEIMFRTIARYKTVTVRPDVKVMKKQPGMGLQCTATRPLETAKEIKCGKETLKRIQLDPIPIYLERVLAEEGTPLK